MKRAAIVAPKQAASWSTAEVRVFVDVSKGGGGHGFGPTTFERVSVEVWLFGDDRAPQLIPFDSRVAKKPLLFGDSEVRRIRDRAYELATSPTGDWIAVCAEPGRWSPIHPDSLLTCRHLELRGRQPQWETLPPIRDLVVDILAHAGGKRGPLGLDHLAGGITLASWFRDETFRQFREVDAAGRFAQAHPDDEELQHAVADLVLGWPNNVIVDGPLKATLARAASQHASVRERLFETLGQPTASAMAVRQAALALAESADARVQAALSRWLVATVPALVTKTIAPFDLAADAVAWALAKSTQELGVADAAVEEAALVAALSHPTGWSSAGIRAMRSYGVQLLGMSGSKRALEALEAIAARAPRRDRQPSWPPNYFCVGEDARDGPVGEVRPEAWAQVALDALGEP